MPDGGQTQADGPSDLDRILHLKDEQMADQIIILVDAAAHVPAQQ